VIVVTLGELSEKYGKKAVANWADVIIINGGVAPNKK